MTTSVLVFKNTESKDKTKYGNFYASSKTEIIINESDTENVFKSIYTTIIWNIQKSLGKISGSIIDSIIDHNISISKYNPLVGRSYIKLPKELDHWRKGLIKIQNIDDNECFKWCLVRYLSPVDHNPRRITKIDKEFAKKLEFKNTKLSVKIRDIHKIEKKSSISISPFNNENKEKHLIYVWKKYCEENHVDLLLIGEEGKRHYALIKDFNTFMFDHTLHRWRKHFCRYCLQAFSSEEILKCHIIDCLKINGKQRIKTPEKGEYVKFKNYERQIKSDFIIYADFESILLPENNGKQNRNESYTNKYQKHITCSYGYQLVCLDDKFSKPFKSYLGIDAVYNFINSMIKESKYSNEVMKKHFNKEIVMTKKDNEDFKNSAICWICDNDYIDGDVKVRYHCHIKGKYRDSAYRDCNINLRLNHKISTVFHNLKNYDSHLIMQEIDKFNVKVNVITNGLEKYISYTVNNKLSATDSLQFRSSSSDSLVKNLNKDNFNYLS